MTTQPRTLQEALEAIEERDEEIALLRAQIGGLPRVEMLETLWALGLTPQESALFSMLHDARGRTLSRIEIVESLPTLDRARDRDLKVVDVIVARVRRKLHPDTVETVWGRGYRASKMGLEIGDRVLRREPVDISPKPMLPYEDRYKLTAEQALEIKRIGHAESSSALASRFGCSVAVVDGIRGGYRYQRLLAKHEAVA